ncbi:hypothetical protein POF50_024220 [Streptomyces sp. SL13]|uniref:Uncharacterized protein n=1 Tax=Streptantibioticus silvisoli TaxID=2705255 RepID=A0AA90H8G5_9ACTN|nr:hypothetical protein [Streptantibioticus silvisoli]MDI5972407.1 hypothetical protein [Streptantibioticus silvisoli]
MEAELVALAGSGASTLVGLMVSDGWEQVRRRIARLLARDGDVPSAEAELERARDGVVAARDDGDEEAESDYVEEWTPRLRRLLRRDPDAGRQLLALLAELGGAAPSQSAGSVHNTISGGVQHGPVFQGRDFFGGLTFNGPPAPGPAPERDG